PIMPLIEDYAFLSDLQTGALVHRHGSIDWCCIPRFDADACFAALLGHDEHGSWRLAPMADGEATRQYRDGSPVLETQWHTSAGRIRVLDFMPPRHGAPTIVRIVEGAERTARRLMQPAAPVRRRRSAVGTRTR